MAADKYTYAKGRRKTSVATVRLYSGKGDSTVNGKPAEEVYHLPMQLDRLNQPFTATKTKGKFYFTAVTSGGGITGQLDAIVLGISRALVKEDQDFKTLLKQEGLLTRDPRMVERKKTGLRKARKARQFSKR